MRTLILFLLFLPIIVFSQKVNEISRLIVHTDTLQFTWPDHAINVKGSNVLPLFYSSENEICEVQFWLSNKEAAVRLLSTADFTIIDSLVNIGEYYRFKVKFQNLTQSRFLKFSFQVTSDTESKIQDIALQPFTSTTAQFIVNDNELFIGEEKIIEIVSNNPDNIRYNNEWKRLQDVSYRVDKNNGRLFLHLVPEKTGNISISLPLSVNQPAMSASKKFVYDLPPLTGSFAVNASRLQFLSVDKKEITYDVNARGEGIELQIDDSRLLQIQKTYRVEEQEEAGGALIAEIFTKQKLANGKVLCTVRPYNYHRISEGYLYIKDGDIARFITNVSITPATSVTKISMLRSGGEWKESNTIYPGETVEIRLEGEGLHKANFYFEGLEQVVGDSLLKNESQITYSIKVPLNIPLKSINIYNDKEATGKTLRVSEYQKPRDFDYIFLYYGDKNRRVSAIRGPILYEKTVKDVVLSVNPDIIDEDALYGRQFLDIEVRILGKKNELIEIRNFDNLIFCPGEKSPRFNFYPTKGCLNDDISLNKYLSRKTYDLEDWSRIVIKISDEKDKYGEEGFEKEVELLLKKKYSFDVEVSFPAGLITISKQEDGQMGFGNLSGISMAMIAQFSFYHPEKIARYRPYKVGAGFLAFNAFNFSDNVEDRDVGIVALGSLYPTTRDVKLSFPLYMGGGYFLKDQQWFFLIGPGIRVKL
ncbi:MAG: hypothetical protein JXB49_12460 [Bacteroidales bacterium]|nr:hypothetical protein [Bacteroidales bacterium]